MTGYRLRFRSQPPGSVHAEGLRPDLLCALTLAELKKQSILCGRISVQLAELFDIEPFDAGNNLDLTIDGCERYVNLASGMQSGILKVAGAAGRFAGAGMRGGRLVVDGDAGDGAGASMRGGRLIIQGNAGNWLGGPFPNREYGLLGGAIIVHGSAGEYAGLRQRRGLIAIRDCGDFPAQSQSGGTLVIAGKCGAAPGLGMKGGTLMLCRFTEQLPSTFALNSNSRPVFCRLLLRRLEALQFTLDAEINNAAWNVYSGDQWQGSRGEAFVCDR